ncbi:MAG: hypothetical protein IVW52_19740 [Acidimicrobiales bacterium]|nr:hypothetical protein [Acidimicrobiales bacterium]
MALVATIVANSGAGLDCVAASGTVTDSGYNLDDDGSCGFQEATIRCHIPPPDSTRAA